MASTFHEVAHAPGSGRHAMPRAENGRRLTPAHDEFEEPESNARVGIAKLGMISLQGLGLVMAGILAVAWFSERESPALDAHQHMFAGEAEGGNTSLAMSPDGTRMATTDNRGRAALWHADDGWWSEKPLEVGGFANVVVFSPDGRLLACGGTCLTLCDLGPAVCRQVWQVPVSGIEALEFSPDGKTLAATFEHNGDILLWDLVEGRERAILPSDSPSILSVAFSPDGRYLAAGDNAEIASISVWNLATRECKLRFKGKFGAIRALKYSHDGSSIATTGAYERGPRLWDVRSGRLLRSFAGHQMGTNSLAFSPDGNVLATGGNDGMARLWNVATGQLQASVNGHSIALPNVGFSPDGCTLAATGFADNDVRLWDLRELARDPNALAVDREDHVAFVARFVSR